MAARGAHAANRSKICKLCYRYGGVVTNCEFSIAVKNDADRKRLRQLASDIQSEGVARAWRTILGIAA
jgi:hypothetical protein